MVDLKELEKYGFSSVEDVMKTGLKKVTTYEAELPRVNADKCSRCGMCDRNCPYFAITMNENKVPEFNSDKCFRCGLCASKCPVKAIEFKH